MTYHPYFPLPINQSGEVTTIMVLEKTQPEKTRLHPRNKNRERYDLNALILSNPELKEYIIRIKSGVESIDFANPRAVKLLNQAILHHYYGIQNWEFPDENLCPPVPGRADYIHYIADLLGEKNSGTIPTGDTIICLDVGTGASCIYPLIGVAEYGWRFIASDINPASIKSAEHIVRANASITDKVECRTQQNSNHIFQGIIRTEDKIDSTICNPPFHSSKEDAQKATRRKIRNLSGKNVETPVLNFAGISDELIYEGGEMAFIEIMIRESNLFSKNCFWFSTLVSKESNLSRIQGLLENSKATEIKTIPMGTGNKRSRVVAWTFLSGEEQEEWAKSRWK